MHFVPSEPDSWFNLPRSSGVAYAAQESWVLNETIRSNIVFDTKFDEERYKKVLYQCALEPDLGLFQAGDQTEVGEKGLQYLFPVCFSLMSFRADPFWWPKGPPHARQSRGKNFFGSSSTIFRLTMRATVLESQYFAAR